MGDFYRQIYVLERGGNGEAIRYVCYEDLATGKFAVDSCEYLKKADQQSLTWFAAQQIDQLIELAPDRWFDTLKEAVEDFEPIARTPRR